MADVREIGENVFSIDDELYSVHGSGCVYFLAEEKKALIDSGPATSAATVLEGIRQTGFRSEDVDSIIITHIHLDHGGGAGTLLQGMPEARVMAHYKAIKHLMDPSRLISSALEAQGEDSNIKNGEVLPVSEDRLVPVHDGDRVDLGRGQVLTLLEAPGHAPHELCIFESRNRGVFVGDAVGHYIEGTDVMVPVTPPPSFDLELYLKTLDRLMNLKAARIYFAHAGTSEQVEEKLESAMRKLRERDRLIARAAAENRLDEAADMLAEHICAELEPLKRTMRPVYDYWASHDIPMSAAEHVRYYKRKHGL